MLGWQSDREPSRHYEQHPTYASIPTEERNLAPEESEDDVQIFMIGELYEPDAESSSATSSDHGTDDEQDAPEDMNETEKIYLRYRRAKRMWRKHTGRPQRRFRRAFRIFNHDKFKKHHYRNKGTPYKPRFGRQYHVALSDAMNTQTRDEFMTHLNAYFGKGKGKGKNRGGVNGFGRRKNPKDKQGNIMLCRLCKSDERFAARCPMRSKGTSPPQLYNSGGRGGSHGWAQHGLGAASSGGYSSMFVNSPHAVEERTEQSSSEPRPHEMTEGPYYMMLSHGDDPRVGTHTHTPTHNRATVRPEMLRLLQ